MISINLLPDVKIQYLKTQRMKYRFISLSVVASIVAIALVVLMAIYVEGIQRLQFSQAQKSAQQLDNTLTADKTNIKVVTIQNQLQSLSTIASQKPVTSRLFGYLQSIVPGNVGLSSVTVDPSTSTITLDGSTDSYKSANAFSDTLKHAKLSYKDSSGQAQNSTPFSSVVFASLGKGGATNGSSTVSFSVSFTYDSNLFAASVTNPTITIPSLNSSQINQPSASKPSATQNATPFSTTLPTSNQATKP